MIIVGIFGPITYKDYSCKMKSNNDNSMLSFDAKHMIGY